MKHQDSPTTVMVIEPDIVIRMEISDYLRHCGFRVAEGADAQDFWAAMKSGTPIDIVFAEVSLQGAHHGFALARDIRQTHPNIDVILTSGIADAAQKSAQLRDEAPMHKPYQPQQVIQRIHILLERRRAAKKCEE